MVCASLRRGGLGDLQDQLLQDRRAQQGAVPAVGFAVGDEVVEDPQDRLRRGDLDGRAGRQAVLTQHLPCAGALEVHEVFHERGVRIGGDQVGDARPVGEDLAGGEGVLAARQSQGPLAAGDELDGVEGEVRAVDPIARPAVLAAAADDGHRLAGPAGGVQVESAGLRHLGREELGLAAPVSVRFAVRIIDHQVKNRHAMDNNCHFAGQIEAIILYGRIVR